jgi:hypothetical protein
MLSPFSKTTDDWGDALGKGELRVDVDAVSIEIERLDETQNSICARTLDHCPWCTDEDLVVQPRRP